MAVERMHSANHAYSGSIGKAGRTLRVAANALARKHGAFETTVTEFLVSKQHCAIGRSHFHETVDNVFRFRMIVVVLSQLQPPVVSKEEQTLDCFNFLDREVIEL